MKCWVCLKNGEKVEGFSGGKGGFWGALILDFVGFDEMKELKRDGDWERDQKCENQFSLVFLYSVRSLFLGVSSISLIPFAFYSFRC